MNRQYSQIWFLDFEFSAAPGERPTPLCLVAKDLISNHTLRLWHDELEGFPAPFNTTGSSLFVAYYASAEMGCFKALGWPLPENVLDLYAEFRVETNGKTLSHGKGLLGALEYYGHNGIESLEKETMRQMVIRGGPYSLSETHAILDYCESDVIAVEKLFQSMLPVLGVPLRHGHALHRGRYTKAVAIMEWHGVPMDTPMLKAFTDNWADVQSKLIQKVDKSYNVYDGHSFNINKFAHYLSKREIEWPRTPTGRLALDDETFVEQAKCFPELHPLRELRHALGKLRLSALGVGSDNRNRCLLSMFSSKTGRNQPSNSKFIFGLSAWLRGLIRPEPGYGLAYIDWSQQEFGIAAALSGDLKMQEAYSSGDPYLTFAKQAGAVPAYATKATHPGEREQYKACVLAVQYGMQAESLSQRIQQPPAYAAELLRIHRRTYSTFWEWSEGVLNYAMINLKLWTVFGWTLHLEGKINGRSVQNFPMQANGAEMLRLACCLGTEAGIKIIAPVHDAVLIEAPIDQLDSQCNLMQDVMELASRQILSGFELRSDVKKVISPGRYEDERGQLMWEKTQEILADLSEASS